MYSTLSSYTSKEFYSTLIDNLTLAQALTIHYDLNPQFTRWTNYFNSVSSKLIKSHDISHILFGCDTSYSGEYTVQTWVRYGVNDNIRKQDILKYLFNKDLIQLVLPPKLIQYSLSHRLEFKNIQQKVKKQVSLMTKKWQYFDEEKYMQTSIATIRSEYNIILM